MRIYQCHNNLAKYFQSTGDKWLADHFYQNCLRYSANVVSDDGKVAAEGHCNVGSSLEEAGKSFRHLLGAGQILIQHCVFNCDIFKYVRIFSILTYLKISQLKIQLRYFQDDEFIAIKELVSSSTLPT